MNLAPPHAFRDRTSGRRLTDDWRKEMPRWALLGMVTFLSFVVGMQYTRQRYLEGAYASAPTSLQARQGERLAGVEAQIGTLTRAVDVLTGDMKQHNHEVAQLAAEMRLLTSAVKRR